jgi:hypothetical protein
MTLRIVAWSTRRRYLRGRAARSVRIGVSAVGVVACIRACAVACVRIVACIRTCVIACVRLSVRARITCRARIASAVGRRGVIAGFRCRGRRCRVRRHACVGPRGDRCSRDEVRNALALDACESSIAIAHPKAVSAAVAGRAWKKHGQGWRQDRKSAKRAKCTGHPERETSPRRELRAKHGAPRERGPARAQCGPANPCQIQIH